MVNNELTLVNGDIGRCAGIFTQCGHVSDSVLDLVVEDNRFGPLISSMTVDSSSNVFGGSDNRSILFEVKSIKVMETHKDEQEKQAKGPSEATATEYREMLESLLAGIDWDDLDTNEKCMAVQEALVQASLLNVKPPRATKAKFYGSKTINRL